MYVRRQLQGRCGTCRRCIFLDRLSHLYRLMVAPSHHDNLFRTEDCTDADRYGTHRHGLCVAEQLARIGAGVVVQQHQTCLAVELCTGFVERDVPTAAYAQQHQVNAAQLLDRALVSGTGFDDLLLGQRSRDSNHVGRQDAYLRYQLFFQLTETARIFLRQRVVLVTYHQHYVAETQSLLVQTDQFGDDVLHRTAGHHAQHELLAFLLALFDQLGDVLCHGYCTFLAGLVNTCLHFLHAAYAREFEDIIGFVQFLRYPTERDL